MATNTCGKFEIVDHVEGGGVTGKAGAINDVTTVLALPFLVSCGAFLVEVILLWAP